MVEVVRILTLIAIIFMLLSFFTSLFGTNFDTLSSPWDMLELKWAYGYPFALGFMATPAMSLIVFFQRRGWIGRRAAIDEKGQ